MPRTPETALSLGPLERELLELLWRRDEPAVVREVLEHVPQLAYTTVMTTLDRLHKKGLLRRVPRGRAFAYEPATSREALHARAAAGVLLDDARSAAHGPLLSCFVDEVGRRDERLLDELEQLVRDARRRRDA